MRLAPTFLALAVAAALAGCARGQQADPGRTPEPARPEPARAQPATPPAPVFTPVGEYDFQTSANGSDVNGTITITGTAGSYRALVTTGVTQDISFSTVRVEGNKISMTAPMDGGGMITMNVVVNPDNTISGDWSMGDMAGTLRGTKRKS